VIFSDSLKAEIGQILDNVHETFGRTITAYKDAENTVVATTPSYNAIYGVDANITKTTVSSSFTVRIKYIKKDEEQILTDSRVDSQLKISLPAGSVRIKVGTIGFNFLKDSKRIDLDGRRYLIINDSFPFSPEYHTFYLKPLDEDE
jgi:hypothetical protein